MRLVEKALKKTWERLSQGFTMGNSTHCQPPDFHKPWLINCGGSPQLNSLGFIMVD